MTENSNHNRGSAGDAGTAIEQPARRKLVVRRETLKDLTTETRSAGKVKGGVPNQTKIVGAPNVTRDL